MYIQYGDLCTCCSTPLFDGLVSMRENKSQVENLTRCKLSCVRRIVKHGNGLLNKKG